MRWRRKSKGVLPVALAAALLALAPARAANGDVSQANQAAAQALFDQGRRLLDEGKYAEACAKFESSQRLDPGTGTLLNLATCDERLGKLATAWTLFNEALSLAIRDGRRDRMSFAREHIISIEPQLPHLTVAVRAAATDGLSLTIDGAPLGKAAWGVAAPVDPGDHVVEATASGKLPFRATVKLAPTESRTLEVPALDDDPEAQAKLSKGEAAGPAPAELPAPPGPAENGTGNATRRLAGEIALGAGAVALGIGTYFGLRAMSIWSDANANCTQDTCSAYGESRTKDARSAARAADVALGIGIAAVGAGVVLVLTAANGHPSQSTTGRTPEGSGRQSTVRRTRRPDEGNGRLILGATLTAYAQGGGLALHGAW